MTEREKLEVGNNTPEADSEFTDGYYNGSLYYYDTNHQLPRPLTSEAIDTFMKDNLFDQRATPRWNAGFVFGWITEYARTIPHFSLTVLSFLSPFLSLSLYPQSACKEYKANSAGMRIGKKVCGAPIAILHTSVAFRQYWK